MLKLPALALASLAVILPAQAQNVAGSAITLSFQNNRGCHITAQGIVPGKDSSEFRFNFNNNGTAAVSFRLQVTISGQSGGVAFSRSFVPSANSGPRQPGAGAYVVTGVNPALPTLNNPSATVTLVDCAPVPANRPAAVM